MTYNETYFSDDPSYAHYATERRGNEDRYPFNIFGIFYSREWKKWKK